MKGQDWDLLYDKLLCLEPYVHFICSGEAVLLGEGNIIGFVEVCMKYFKIRTLCI